MRKDVEFKTGDGVTLRGWHYVPENAACPFPTIIMAHGFSSVKEMYLDKFAEAFAEAGLASIVYDHRNFGASDGAIRQEVDPWVQISDYRDAITFAETLPETDAARIGIWGSSFSGGHVLVVAAQDRRVKAVVSQVPITSGHENVRRLIRADFIDATRQIMDEDRRNRMKGAAPMMIPVVDENPIAQSALPTPDSYAWYMGTHKARAPSWKNEVTLRSVEKFFEYNPGSYIPYISPTPLMMIVGKNDVVTITDLALSAYEDAREPKQLVLLNGGHFDAYTDGFDSAAQPAIEWFKSHLSDA